MLVIVIQEPQDGISLMVVLIVGPRYKPIDIFYSKSIESYSVGFALYFDTYVFVALCID